VAVADVILAVAVEQVATFIKVVSAWLLAFIQSLLAQAEMVQLTGTTEQVQLEILVYLQTLKQLAVAQVLTTQNQAAHLHILELEVMVVPAVADQVAIGKQVVVVFTVILATHADKYL
jgi:hypothetical protein